MEANPENTRALYIHFVIASRPVQLFWRIIVDIVELIEIVMYFSLWAILYLFYWFVLLEFLLNRSILVLSFLLRIKGVNLYVIHNTRGYDRPFIVLQFFFWFSFKIPFDYVLFRIQCVQNSSLYIRISLINQFSNSKGLWYPHYIIHKGFRQRQSFQQRYLSGL